MTIDVAQGRRQVAALQGRWRQAQPAFDEVKERGSADGLVHKLSCPKKGCGQVLASVYSTSLGWLFCSKILWRPVDQKRLPPWLIESMLRRVDLKESSENIETQLRYLLGPRVRVDDTGNRWLQGAPPTWIIDLVTVRPGEFAPTLWLRCEAHPGRIGRISREPLQAGFDRRPVRLPQDAVDWSDVHIAHPPHEHIAAAD